MRRKEPKDYQKLAENRGFRWLGPCPKGVREKTTWLCPKGHEWLATYDSLQQGSGCNICAKNRQILADGYEKIAQEKGIKWLGPYPGSVDSRTWWECSHGHRWETGYTTIRKSKKYGGCPYCHKIVRKLPDDYHELADSRNFEWLGPEVSVTGYPTKWKCKKGHIWKAPYNSIQQGQGCPHCAGNVRKLQKDYHELAMEHGFIWVGPTVKKVSLLTGWECKKGHFWKSRYNDIQQGNGCPYCKVNKGEQKIAQILKSWGIHFERQKRFNQCRDSRPLPFDFYFRLGKHSVLIEFDGAQHFVPVDYWGGEKALRETKKHDSIKNKFAKDFGFILIRVPYTVKGIKAFLRQELVEYVFDINIYLESNKKLRLRRVEKIGFDSEELYQLRLDI